MELGLTIIGVVVGLGIALYFVAGIIGPAITAFVAVDTATWTGTFAIIASIWPFIPVIVIVAILFTIFLVAKARMHHGASA